MVGGGKMSAKRSGEKRRLVSHNKTDKLLFYKKEDKQPQSIKLPNNETLTTALEVQIVDDYLLGKKNSYWPLPDVDETINTISKISYQIVIYV